MPRKNKIPFYKTRKFRHVFHWSALCFALLVSMIFVEMKGQYFRASIIHLDEQHAPYDGLEFPIKKIPNWVEASDAERQLAYADFPLSKFIDIPAYNLNALSFNPENLEWNNAEHDRIRNIQITYPVLYRGTYNLDGKEGGGSHPAIDIKALAGTPVYAIGNGKVVKVSQQNDGFGQHIVLKHRDFPSYEDASKSEDYFSSYSHLSKILVKEGDLVTRGQKIGEVGHTGTATTDHLHFQIDNNDAPWHPHWPFTYKEALAANVSFFDAVSTGLGKSNVEKYTIHPIRYIEKYGTIPEGYAAPSSLEDSPDESSDEVMDDVVHEAPDNEIVSDDADHEISDKETDEPIETNVSHFAFIHDLFYLNGREYMVNIEALDKEGERVLVPKFRSLSLKASNSVISVDESSFSMKDFHQGKTAFSFTPRSTGTTHFILELDETLTVVSEKITIRDAFKDIRSFAIEHDGSFEPEVAEAITIIALDEDKNRTPKYNFSGDATLKLKSGKGLFSPSEVGKKDFLEGAAVVKFYGESSKDAIIEVNYQGIKGESVPLAYRLFDDVSGDHENFSAIKYLRDQGIVSGYSDGTFQPDRRVTRAEALKIIFEATGQLVMSEVALNFLDVDSDAWYHDYVSTAYSLNIVKGYDDGTFRPGAEVSRVEFIKILLNALGVDIDPLVSEKPFKDVSVSAWFAPYVQFAKEKDLLVLSGEYFRPHGKITRSEVAEITYRALQAE